MANSGAVGNVEKAGASSEGHIYVAQLLFYKIKIKWRDTFERSFVLPNRNFELNTRCFVLCIAATKASHYLTPLLSSRVHESDSKSPTS